MIFVFICKFLYSCLDTLRTHITFFVFVCLFVFNISKQPVKSSSGAVPHCWLSAKHWWRRMMEKHILQSFSMKYLVKSSWHDASCIMPSFKPDIPPGHPSVNNVIVVVVIIPPGLPSVNHVFVVVVVVVVVIIIIIIVIIPLLNQMSPLVVHLSIMFLLLLLLLSSSSSS